MNVVLVIVIPPWTNERSGVSVRVSIAVMKHHDQKQVGEERVYLAYTPNTEGSQDKNSSRVGTCR